MRASSANGDLLERRVGPRGALRDRPRAGDREAAVAGPEAPVAAPRRGRGGVAALAVRAAEKPHARCSAFLF